MRAILLATAAAAAALEGTSLSDAARTLIVAGTYFGVYVVMFVFRFLLFDRLFAPAEAPTEAPM